MNYILAIDQSTSGTKAILFDGSGRVAGRRDLPHEQKIDGNGWVSHDPMEIYRNTVAAVRDVIGASGVDRSAVACVGLTNQRETALVWERAAGLPVCDAVVWQCARGKSVTDRLTAHADMIRHRTGLPLSPYFSAAKLAWVLENANLPPRAKLCAGTVDSWLVYKLTGGAVFATDYSNASRTQLLNLRTLEWDGEIAALFGIDASILPELRDSDGLFGETDFDGFLPRPIPIRAVLGDSHAALYGHGCGPGMAKSTYGTGSSVMMNIGERPVHSEKGLATSLAWRLGGKAEYVLEGNINYSCAVIKWLVEDVKLLAAAREAGPVARTANPQDMTYLVPAFTGLGAPHWLPDARAVLCGMGRTTGRAEIVRAAEECIAYQIADIVGAMGRESGVPLTSLRADGDATRDGFLMQFQSDILGIPVEAAGIGELSAWGAAAAAGTAMGICDAPRASGGGKTYTPGMDAKTRAAKLAGWRNALGKM